MTHTTPSRCPVLAITQGDPLGIGPEILIRALADGAAGATRPVVLGDRELLERTAHALALPLAAEIVPSPVTGAASALWALEEACRMVVRGDADAIVTAPVHKADLVRAGFRHPGQTEFLGERLGGVETTMLLAGATLRVALVTTHLALRDVPDAVTTARVAATIRRLHAGLIDAYGIARPRIGVLGLNPHAGEEGLFGREEIDVIGPGIEQCRRDGIDCRGPLPGDGTFAPRSRAAFDGIVAMYHDQGLAGLKAAEGGASVNVTLGLPVLRTSPDHGTARDIAGRGIADAGSMIEAVRLAERWASARPSPRRRS